MYQKCLVMPRDVMQESNMNTFLVSKEHRIMHVDRLGGK